MTEKISENLVAKNFGKILKTALICFVFASIAVAVYKALPCCSGDKARPAILPIGAAAPAASEKADGVMQVAAKDIAAKPAEAKTIVVYYFFTETRCSSCKAIEAYTREAVETKLAGGYKGWNIVFKGFNLDKEENKHFIQDYWLNSKMVVIQKFSGGKALGWGRLEKVWQLLDDKDAFIDYVVDETHKLADEK